MQVKCMGQDGPARGWDGFQGIFKQFTVVRLEFHGASGGQDLAVHAHEGGGSQPALGMTVLWPGV